MAKNSTESESKNGKTYENFENYREKNEKIFQKNQQYSALWAKFKIYPV